LDDESLSKLVQTMPSALGMNAEENLEPKLEWLGERLVLDDASLSEFAQQCASVIICCNIENNLEPAIKFYEECVGLDAARTLVTNSPTLLTRSLEKRLKPRLAECQEAGVPIDAGTLQRIAKMTTGKWSSSMAFQRGNC
jgi:hypothetical protein